jgi:cytochrome P450
MKVIDDKKDGIMDNMNEMMKDMTLDVLGKCIFGHEFNSVIDHSQKELNAYHNLIESLMDVKSVVAILFLSKFSSFIPFLSKLSDNIKLFNSLVSNLIEVSKEKLKSGKDPEFMLDFMVKSTFEDETMNVEELKSNIFAFFVAGHETTATTLGFIIQLLAKHPKIQEKARKEISELCQTEEDVNYENSKKMNYLLMIIKETMRMFPPASVIQREVTQDVEIGGYNVPKGAFAVVNVFSLHYNKEVYKNPHEFRPERWEEESISNFAWIPFSVGSRVCIGNNFSLLEQKIFLATMLRNFKWSLTDSNEILESPTSFLLQPMKRNIKFERIL